MICIKSYFNNNVSEDMNKKKRNCSLNTLAHTILFYNFSLKELASYFHIKYTLYKFYIYDTNVLVQRKENGRCFEALLSHNGSPKVFFPSIGA